MKKNTKKDPPGFCPPEFMGTTVLGERGQVVIPKELRDEFNLKPGARLVVLKHGPEGAIILFPAEHLQELMHDLTTRLTTIQKKINNT